MSEVKTNKISSLASNNDITIDPDGTGNTIIASGEVGVGTTTPATFTDFVSGSNAPSVVVAGSQPSYVLADTDISGNDGTLGITKAGEDTVINNLGAGNVRISNNGSERMRIDSSGNFGIGTSSPAVALHVQAGSGQFRLHEGNAADNKYGEIEVSNGKLILHSDKGDVESNTTMQFHLDNSEKMRIDSSGNVGINATSGGARLHVEDETNDQVAFFHNTNSGFSSTNVQISTSRNTTGGAYNHLACSIHGVATKFIVYDGGQVVNSTNSYGQISDQRLKENIADASSQWDDIKALQVRNFNFIGDDLTQIGVVAQEVETAGMNGLIQEAAWYDAASNPDSEVRKTVKYSVLYMKAVKALQEAMTRIETLETKVAALEAGE
jgi:hypothetical protein